MRTTILFVLALTACKHHDSTPPPPPPSQAAAAPDVAQTTSGAPGSQNLAPLAGLATQLHAESARRPGVKVTAEKLFESLSARGIALASTKQVLATTAQADYCALGVTTENIAIAVCEYASTAAARVGKKLLDTRYAALVPDAVRAINGSTLVTIAHGANHRGVRDQVLATFMSL